MLSLHDIKYAFVSLISTLEFRDVIDVAVLAYIIYILLKLIRETRAGQLVKVFCSCRRLLRKQLFAAENHQVHSRSGS